MARLGHLAKNVLRKGIVVFAALLFMAPAMRGDEFKTISLLGFAIFDPVQLPDSSIDIEGLRLSIFYGKNRSVKGLDISAFVSVVEDDFYGLEFSVFANNIGSSSGSLQIAGVANSCYGDFKGVQVSCIANFADGNVVGGQISSFNTCKGISGVQVGAFNMAESVSGCQIGVINIAREMEGFQLGLLNIIKNSSCPFFPIVNAHF